MIVRKVFSCAAVCICALLLLSCKQDGHADATQPLQQSFQTAGPAVTQAIASVTTSLKSGNYTEAGRALEPVLAGRKLTAEQQKAIGVLFNQISQAVSANPALDSKELYELRVRLAKAARGDRF